MAAGKEIRGKIKSVENTKKITKAMEMVAASKMRKAIRFLITLIIASITIIFMKKCARGRI